MAKSKVDWNSIAVVESFMRDGDVLVLMEGLPSKLKDARLEIQHDETVAVCFRKKYKDVWYIIKLDILAFVLLRLCIASGGNIYINNNGDGRLYPMVTVHGSETKYRLFRVISGVDAFAAVVPRDIGHNTLDARFACLAVAEGRSTDRFGRKAFAEDVSRRLLSRTPEGDPKGRSAERMMEILFARIDAKYGEMIRILSADNDTARHRHHKC